MPGRGHEQHRHRRRPERRLVGDRDKPAAPIRRAVDVLFINRHRHRFSIDRPT